MVGDCSLTDLGAWAITTRRIGYRSFFRPLVLPRTRPSSSLTSLVNFSPLVGLVWHQAHTHSLGVSFPVGHLLTSPLCQAAYFHSKVSLVAYDLINPLQLVPPTCSLLAID